MQAASAVAPRPTVDDRAFLSSLRSIVGDAHVLTGAERTRRFSTGYRFGGGPVVAVVRPASLVEQWKVLQACVAADKIVIMQAANTGLTGGSTPDGAGYDRGVVIVNGMRIKGVHPIDQGRQVICKPGATLFELEMVLKPLGREPHSVIGSSCIGASVFGGVANNSGGSLVHRGPVYTEMALYARVGADGAIELVDHLGVRLGNDPEAILRRLDAGDFSDADVSHETGRVASDQSYAAHVREVDAPTPARFNADPQRLYEASGSAGKVMLFAVRLDTFPQEKGAAVFYIGVNDPAELTEIRRHILGRFERLPIAGEYMHRDAYDMAADYGKDTFLAIQKLGTDKLPRMFAMKAAVDSWAGRLKILPPFLSDRVMQAVSRLFPRHLPQRLDQYRDRFEHHLMLKVQAEGVDEARAYLSSRYPSETGDFFECTPEEGTAAFLHRFAVAGAAVRYRAVHHRRVEDIVALDVALRRDDRDWTETLPPEIEAPILRKLYYGHFLCYVFHQDYIVAKGTDAHALERKMLPLLDRRGAEYPAEHNVGHLYAAKPALLEHYRSLDPCNCFNPGVGQTSKARNWGAFEAA